MQNEFLRSQDIQRTKKPIDAVGYEAKELVIGVWRLDDLAALAILALSSCSLFRTRVASEGFKIWKYIFWNQLFIKLY